MARVTAFVMVLACVRTAAAQEPAPTPTALLPASADSTHPSVPQRDVMDVAARLLGRDPVATEAVYHGPSMSYSLLPGAGYNPSYGAYVGISVVASGPLGDARTTTPSSLSAGGSISTTHQVSLQIRTDFYTTANQWKLSGDWRYLDTSEDTYGLGSTHGGQSAYPMAFTLYRFYQTVTRVVGGSGIGMGLGYLLDKHAEIDDSRGNDGEDTPYLDYSGGSTEPTVASGISLEMLVDSRDNPINPTRGVLLNTSLRSFTKALGSDDDWQGLWNEFRAFHQVRRDPRQVVAVWNYTWVTFGHAPYFDLPASTWDRYARAGRGYLRGRIRGQSQIYTEGEYRRTFTRDGLIGGVVFMNVMATSGTAGGSFGTLDPAGGVGLRFKFNKRSDMNAAVDVAWGDHGPGHVFFGLQEVF